MSVKTLSRHLLGGSFEGRGQNYLEGASIRHHPMARATSLHQATKSMMWKMLLNVHDQGPHTGKMVCAVGLTVMFTVRPDITGYQWGNPYIFV